MSELPKSLEKDESTYDDMLRKYVQVCNMVMQHNRDRFPYSQIWQAGEQALSGRAIEFAVVDDEPKAHCRVTLSESKLASGDEPEAVAKVAEQPPVMRLTARYIEDVVENPDKYIENPSLIDWEWLRILPRGK